jgi:hypothetical protein
MILKHFQRPEIAQTASVVLPIPKAVSLSNEDEQLPFTSSPIRKLSWLQKSLPRALRTTILRIKDTALLKAIPVRNHALNATYRGVLNNQILVEQQARYLHKTDPLKTAVLSYRASYSLQQACQAKLGEPTDKTVFL